MSLVYDCFLFFNELDLLEIRFNVLSEQVDKFVLVEADRTFTNKEKKFYFDENKERYKPFLDKIIHIKISEYPDKIEDAWRMQDYQRDQIIRGIENCSPSDIILISDLDEITNPEAIKQYKETDSGICRLKQLHFDYYLNYQRCGKNHYWYSAKIAKYKDMLLNNYSPQNIRSLKDLKVIKNGGWHFSFLGNIESIIYKIQSISMQKWNNEKYLNDRLEYKIRMGLDLFDRKNIRLIPIKISNKKHPKYIVNNQEKYSHLIFPHINRFIVIKNTLYCVPYYIAYAIKQFIKTLLPKKLTGWIKNFLNRSQKKGTE